MSVLNYYVGGKSVAGPHVPKKSQMILTIPQADAIMVRPMMPQNIIFFPAASFVSFPWLPITYWITPQRKKIVASTKRIVITGSRTSTLIFVRMQSIVVQLIFLYDTPTIFS